MHVLHRPFLPRLVSVSIVAAILAIVISLALAPRLSNISRPLDTTGSSLASHTASALTNAPTSAAPRWATSPFATLLSRPLPEPWLAARR